jgi:tRNA(adenine34) deaminase
MAVLRAWMPPVVPCATTSTLDELLPWSCRIRDLRDIRALRGLNRRVSHEEFMSAALDEARRGLAAGEVPIGAVLVVNEQIAARAFNQPIGSVDPTAHAEILVLREAAKRIGNYRLTGATLYVTVEPCLMCVGALVHARVGHVVYGAAEPKTGALVSAVRGLELAGLNHRFEVGGGVLENDCRDLIQTFFHKKRAESRGL